MNHNAYYVEEHEVSFKHLFWKLLLHWKTILIVACLFAVLGYGYAKYTQHNSQEFESETNGDLDEQLMDYELAEKSIYEAVDKYELALNNERYYMENSLLMKLNPYRIIYAVKDAKHVLLGLFLVK